MATLMRRSFWPFDVEWPKSLLADWPVWPTMSELDLRVEEFREGDTLVVRAEMPGVDPDRDVEITVHEGVLTIHAERKQELKTEEKGGFRSEFKYGSFERSVRLPLGATEDDVKASYSNGILEVRIPISTMKAEAHKVPVTTT